MAIQPNEPVTKADLEEVADRLEQSMRKEINQAVTASQEEVLGAVNNGFTRMQHQTDQRFAESDAKHEQLRGEMNRRFDESDREQEAFREETNGNFTALNRRLDSTITRTDAHERALSGRNASPAN